MEIAPMLDAVRGVELTLAFTAPPPPPARVRAPPCAAWKLQDFCLCTGLGQLLSVNAPLAGTAASGQ
jgi:hypothetical protein